MCVGMKGGMHADVEVQKKVVPVNKMFQNDQKFASTAVTNSMSALL